MNYNIEPILARAQEFILVNNRKLFDPYYARIEDFSAERKLPITGNAGIALACGEPRPLNILYELYSDSPYKAAVDLTNALYEIKSLHVYMRTDIKHVEMTILIDTIETVKIYRMDRFNSVRLTDIVKTVETNGFMGGKVFVFSPLVYLMIIYRNLYSPAKFTQDPKLLERAAILRGMIQAKSGGDDPDGRLVLETNPAWLYIDSPYLIDVDDAASHADPADPANHADNISITGGRRGSKPIHRSKFSIDVINSAMMDEFSEFILVGELAAKLILGQCKINDPPRVQFISDESPEIIAKRLRKITSADITFKQYSLFTDFQLVRTTYFIHAKDSIPIMDVYNSSRFEMIPWESRDDMRVGNMFVVARFLCIEIFSMKVISAISGAAFKHRIELLQNLLLAITALEPEFQLEDYAGVYLVESIQKKKILAEADKPPPYFPEMGIKTI